MVAFLNFADLGLGNGLLNSLAKNNASDDRSQAQKDVSTAFFLLAAIAAALGLGLVATSSILHWGDFFRLGTSEAGLEVSSAVAAFFIAFLISVPFAVGQKIELAYQTGYRFNASFGVATLLSFGGLLAAIWADAGLPLLVAAAVAPLALAGAISSLRNFFWTRPWLRPQLSKVNKVSVRLIAGSGVLFLALQVSVSLSYSLDNVVITRVLGPAAVPSYAIPFKLFNTVHFLISVLMAPLWPAYREAFVRRDHPWIRQTLRRSIYISLAVGTACALVLVIGGRSILHLWLGRDLETSTGLLVGLGLWTVLAGVGTAIAMFLNGTGILRVQVVLALLMTVANVGLSIFLVSRIGIEGAIWSTVISYSLIVMIPLVFYIPRLLARLGADFAATKE